MDNPLYPTWTQDHLDEWRKYNHDRIEESKREFDAEEERKREWAAVAEVDAEAEAEAECWKCGGLDHLAGGNLILLCDGDDCSGAVHLKCNDPPPYEAPGDDMSDLLFCFFVGTAVPARS